MVISIAEFRLVKLNIHDWSVVVSEYSLQILLCNKFISILTQATGTMLFC